MRARHHHTPSSHIHTHAHHHTTTRSRTFLVQACQAGSVSNGSAATCTPCLPGFFAAAPGSDTCQVGLKAWRGPPARGPPWPCLPDLPAPSRPVPPHTHAGLPGVHLHHRAQHSHVPDLRDLCRWPIPKRVRRRLWWRVLALRYDQLCRRAISQRLRQPLAGRLHALRPMRPRPAPPRLLRPRSRLLRGLRPGHLSARQHFCSRMLAVRPGHLPKRRRKAQLRRM